VMPEGYTAMHGLPISVLILILVAVVMTLVAKKKDLCADGLSLRAGRADRPGAPAKPRQRHRHAGRTAGDRRAVIGGTALAGGVGTIYGAVLGALIMQSLQSGMAMVGVDTPFQNIVVGLVLVIAVWVDILYRKRLGLTK
jgi:D-xylose transport system permease protein